MKIEEVKQWNCGNGLAVAVNPYIYTEKDFYIRKSEGESWGDFYSKKSIEFNKWASDPANQPVTDLSGVYNSDQVKEVWEYRGVLSDDWAQDRPTVYALFPSFDAYSIYAKSLCAECETRRRLVLAEPKIYHSIHADGEKCVICKRDADRKIGEQILSNNPNKFTHELTAYVCNGCFDLIFKRYTNTPAEIKIIDEAALCNTDSSVKEDKPITDISKLQAQFDNQMKHKESIKQYWLSCSESKNKWVEAIKEYFDGGHNEISTFEDFKYQFDLD
jgi:hypothetical protein